MIPCPKCGNDFPEKRKELGYSFCINCSTEDRVVGITTLEGQGDHTYNDLIIMDRKKAIGILQAEAAIKGTKLELGQIVDTSVEMQNYEEAEKVETNEFEEGLSQSLNPSDKEVSDYDALDPNKEFEGIQGIDY